MLCFAAMPTTGAQGGTTTGINVLDPQFYVDPWEAYRWLQDEAPVFWDPVQQLWAISRYDDIRSVEKDGERFSSFDGSRPHIDQRSDESMINMDDPAHQTQRSLVLRRFTPRAISGHEERVRDIVTGILDDVASHGECEAIEAIASRLPAMMIGELMGYPHELWERVRYWSEQIMLLAGQTSPDGPPAPHPPRDRPGHYGVRRGHDGAHRGPQGRSAATTSSPYGPTPRVGTPSTSWTKPSSSSTAARRPPAP